VDSQQNGLTYSSAIFRYIMANAKHSVVGVRLVENLQMRRDNKRRNLEEKERWRNDCCTIRDILVVRRKHKKMSACSSVLIGTTLWVIFPDRVITDRFVFLVFPINL
jgi:hypothetical protein